MERTPVQSALIESIGYDPDSNIMEIQFKTGTVLEFFDVPLQLHKKFMEADSPGKFFTKNVQGVYLASRLK